MRAVMCKAFGAINTLSVENTPSPTPKRGEVLVSVKAAAINFPDALVVQGLYQVKPSLPFSPGMELAGIVTEVGAGVDGWARSEEHTSELQSLMRISYAVFCL